MFTKEMLLSQLKEMHVPQNVPVLCHTSLRAVGEVEGRGEGLLRTLIEYVTADGGVLLIPTHTWANLMKDCVTMDMTSCETCVGTLPSIAAGHPDAHRSLHPTHSMAAFGEGAEEFIAGECMTDSSTSPKGCYGRMWERGGKILLIGVVHNRNTYLHAVEELMNVPGRMSAEYADTTIRLKDGSVINRPLRYHCAPGIGDVSARYTKYEPAFRHHGCITDGMLGAAKCQLCDCVGMRDTMMLIRERSGGAELFSDDEPIPEAFWR